MQCLIGNAAPKMVHSSIMLQNINISFCPFLFFLSRVENGFCIRFAISPFFFLLSPKIDSMSGELRTNSYLPSYTAGIVSGVATSVLVAVRDGGHVNVMNLEEFVEVVLGWRYATSTL